VVKRLLLACVCSGSICAGVLEAHHSIAAVYDGSKSVTLDGTITRFEFVNPHPVLTIDVVNPAGSAEPWRLEMDNRSELAAVGVTAQTFKAGDHVVVSGSPARSQSRGLYLLKLERPADGFGYEQVGGSPRIRSRSR
jgi:hypothetical protein